MPDLGMKRARRPGRTLLLGLSVLVLSASTLCAKDALPRVTIAVGGASCLCYLPVVIAAQLGEYEKPGVDVDLISFRGGSQALTAVLAGSADVVMGYFDHCVILAAQKQNMQAFVTFGRFPGLVLAVAPGRTQAINSIQDLVGRVVGITAPGSSTDFFLKFLLRRHGVDVNAVSVVGIGLDAAAVAAQEQGLVEAAVMNDPSATVLERKFKDLKILSDTRTAKDTREVYGGDYPSGVLYARAEWIARHEAQAQAIADAVVASLRWIHAHSAEEIMARMPPDMVGPDRALYLAALRKTMPMYSDAALMDPDGARAVVEAIGQSLPDVANAHVDVTNAYTNRFVAKANARLDLESGTR